MVRAILLALLVLSLGCATNTTTGESEVDRDQCVALTKQAAALKLACALIDGADPDEVAANRARCRIGVDIAGLAAELGCSFADDHADPE